MRVPFLDARGPPRLLNCSGSSLDERDDAVRAEAGRIRERGAFVHAAATGERVEVAAGGAVLPRPSTGGDELVDTEVCEPVGLRLVVGDREARRASPRARAARGRRRR